MFESRVWAITTTIDTDATLEPWFLRWLEFVVNDYLYITNLYKIVIKNYGFANLAEVKTLLWLMNMLQTS